MANSNKRPPDKSDLKYYKCHPNKPVKTVICIICENAYHKKHVLRDITSNSDEHMLNDVAKKVIALIKMKQTKEIREELLQDLQNKTLEKHNAVINKEESDIDSLITENNLLKQLVAELQDKNQLQKDIIELQKQKNTETQINKKTYAEAMSEIKPKPKRIPRITVKANDPNQKDTMELLTSCLVTEKNIQTKFIRKKNDNVIEINCMNTKSLETVENALKKKMKNCAINIEQQGNPKMKIIGISNVTKMDEDEIELDFDTRNFKQFQNKAKVLHMYTNKRNKTDTVLMEVSPEIYKNIRESNNKIFVGHQCCKAYDLINVNPCFNCGRFGHNTNKCRNDPVCIKCSDNHNVSECKNSNIECINCSYNNTTYRTSLPTDHLPTDRLKCSILKKKIKQYINSIDYLIEPTLPAFDESSAMKQLCNMQANKQLYQRQLNTNKNSGKTVNSRTTSLQQRTRQQTSQQQQSNNGGKDGLN
ncbi:uncharacterized protein LOC107270492 [Cephus cinctus]|uniref:Uncharacterized protein LOC107270492 n=1 Tax=Cephus cinctus TaxID=211228 RepID=A0AAJ7FNV4_CEPCN|nr:uncharacterized protein LOC107270492 [Cephus cinctus]